MNVFCSSFRQRWRPRAGSFKRRLDSARVHIPIEKSQFGSSFGLVDRLEDAGRSEMMKDIPHVVEPVLVLRRWFGCSVGRYHGQKLRPVAELRGIDLSSQ